MKNWKVTFCFMAALGFSAPFGLNAADEEKGDAAEEEKVVPPGEKMAAVMKGHEEGMREFFEKRREAKTDTERAELKMPDAAAAAFEVLELVKIAPADPKAAEAVFWAARTGMQEPTVMSVVMEAIRTFYLDTEGVEGVCLLISFGVHPDGEDFLNHVRKESKRGASRCASVLALGIIRKRQNRLEEAEKLFEEVLAEFPDVEFRGHSLSKHAERELFAMRNLKVGEAAPEIEGEKADGEPFKLSEYRGKVVVLDFFGDW